MPVPTFIPIVPYADRAFAAQYFAQRMNTDAWDGADDATKDKALAMATQHMDGLSYAGYKNEYTSQREFPRNGMAVIPYEVACANCEEALAILQGKVLEVLEDQNAVTSEQIGDVSTQYQGPSPLELIGSHGGFLSPVSFRLMAAWMRDDDSFFIDRV